MKIRMPKKHISGPLGCALLAVCGSLFALPLIFGKSWLVAWVALVPAAVCEMRRKITKHYLISSYFHGMCFFMAFGLITFSWFWQLYPLDYMGFTPGEALTVVLAAHIGLSLIQATVSSFIFVLWGVCRKRNTAEKRPLLFCLYTSSLWVISEWLQSITWAGVPWGRPALTQASFLPAMQSASLLGSYLVTFIIIFVNCAVATSILTKGGTRGLLAALGASVFIANTLFGVVRIYIVDHTEMETVKVAAVQGNVQYAEKWNGTADNVLDRYRELSADAASDGAELIVWPETAIGYDLSENEYVSRHIEETAYMCSSELLCGAFLSEDNKLYNIIRHITPDGTDSTEYKKQHLVPFGEYVPGEELIRRICPPLAALSPIDYPITAGNDSAVFTTKNGKVTSLICFDSIYSELALKGVRDGGELICISTNDSWFDGSAAQYQHNYHAALRAVECGRYVVRAANTGISSIITPTGEITRSLGCRETGYITGDVSFISSKTPYTYLGGIMVPLCAAAAVIITIYIIYTGKNLNDRNNNRRRSGR